MKRSRVTVVPLMAAVSALFLVLPRGSDGPTVEIRRAGAGARYAPASVNLSQERRVTFVNRTRVTHTATCDDCRPGSVWDTGDIQPGQTVVLTLERGAGTSFSCRYHGPRAGEAGRIATG